jgi:hypothetical protein
VSVDAVTAIVGVALLITVGVSALRTEVDPSRPTQVLAGTASGFLGTVASLGGPILGLALQSRPGPELRATLALVFGLGASCRSARSPSPAPWPRRDRARGAPDAATFAGLLLGRPLAGRLDGGRLRTAVLAFAGAGGVAALLRVALG